MSQSLSSPTLKVLIFSASLRADSLNSQLAALAAGVARAHGATVNLASMHDFDVPVYDGDLEAKDGIPTRRRQSRSVGLARPAGASRRASLPRHVLAIDGAQGDDR